MAQTPVGRVYLITKPSHRSDGSYPDLDPLRKYGEIHYLVGEDVRPSSDPESAFDQIEHQLEVFDHRVDKIAWAGGDMLAAVMTGVCLARTNIPWFTFLRYDRHYNPKTRTRYRGGFYYPVKVSMTNVVPDPNQLDLGIEEGNPNDDK